MREETIVTLSSGRIAPDLDCLIRTESFGGCRTTGDKGRFCISILYPKDMTSECTEQACSFRDLMPQFREKGAVVLGVNKDSVASRKKFEQTHGLAFSLLSCLEMNVIQAYDVWKVK